MAAFRWVPGRPLADPDWPRSDRRAPGRATAVCGATKPPDIVLAWARAGPAAGGLAASGGGPLPVTCAADGDRPWRPVISQAT